MRSLLLNVCAVSLLAISTASCGGSGGATGSSSGTTTGDSTPAITFSLANPIADLSIEVGEQIDVYFAIDTFSDPNEEIIRFNVEFDPISNFSVTGATGTTRVTGTPSTTGVTTVTIIAEDFYGRTVTDSFNIIVTESTVVVTDKPNILFIISDDQGQDSSAQYNFATGTDIPNTPALNALAANGLVFDNAWVNPLCAPTRASLITGKYSLENGVTDVTGGLNVLDTATHDTLFDYFSTNVTDYASAMIGKWHLGGGNSGPADAGVDHYVVVNSGGIDDYESWPKNDNGTITTSSTYVTTDFTNEAIDWIDDQTDPWFLWLAHIAPHVPFHVPPTDLQSRVTSTASSNRELYVAAIEAMDTETDRLLNSMSAADRANTIIVYLGDNGTPGQVDLNGDALNGAKGGLFEGGMRVPLVISGNAVTRTGRESALVNGTDFFNTFVELAGGTSNASLANSQSFAGLLTDNTVATRDYIFTESPDGWAIRDQQYKLIEYTNGSQDLFDLINDPDESADLLDGAVDVSAIVTRLENAKPT